MADYSHLSSMSVKVERTADYTFYNIPGEPVLRCRHAGEPNKPYYNEVLRRAEHLNKRRTKISVDVVKDNRERDCELYPKYVVTGWPVAPRDKSGAQHPFSAEECGAWLRAIPADEMDNFREWARDPNNFRDQMDAEGAAGNSPTV